MGALTAAIESVTSTDKQKEQQARERLELLLTCARAKVRAYKDEINEMFMNPGSVNKIQVPGIRAIRFIEQYHVATQTGFNAQVADHLNRAIDAFFSLNKAPDKAEAVKNGVKALIETALDGFVGSTSAGETEDRVYVVIPENNAFVRVDIACWKYNFSQATLIDTHDSAVAYVLCKSVVDHTSLAIDELIYLTTQALSGGERVPPADTAPVETHTGGSDQKGADEKGQGAAVRKALPMIDANVVRVGAPVSLAVVETYIEEMIRVWRKLREDRQ